MSFNTSRVKALGQSGDDVDFDFSNNEIVVRKSSRKNPERLGLQAQKQQNFPKITDFNIPKITKQWDGSSFEMEYVPGVPLGHFLKMSSTLELELLIEKISSYFQFLFSKSEQLGLLVSNQHLINKLFQMREQAVRNSSKLSELSIDTLLDWAKKVQYINGPNHGDFSFENILVNQHTVDIWLIDMLNSPIESPLIDIGRLLLDAENGWWQSGVSPSATELIAGKSLARAIRNICLQNSISNLDISFFKCFAALRVIPYTTTTIRKSILINVIEAETSIHKTKGLL